jgi:hypothetical protein
MAKAGLVAGIFLYVSCTINPAAVGLLFTLSAEKMCVSGFHSGSCEEFYRLGCNDV